MRNRFIAPVVALGLGACGPRTSSSATTPALHGDHDAAALLVAENDAYQKARPVFDDRCAKCHTQTGKEAAPKSLAHFEMTSYPFGGHHAATIGFEVREALGLTGEKAIMPSDKPGSLTAADLATIDAWAQAWIKADAAGAHGPKPPMHDHDDHDD